MAGWRRIEKSRRLTSPSARAGPRSRGDISVAKFVEHEIDPQAWRYGGQRLEKLQRLEHEIARAVHPGVECQWLRPADHGRRARRTAGAVYHVIEGRGTSRLGDTELGWERGDTFCRAA